MPFWWVGLGQDYFDTPLEVDAQNNAVFALVTKMVNRTADYKRLQKTSA